jgi:uncharacterized protein involved in propanediol utilization
MELTIVPPESLTGRVERARIAFSPAWLPRVRPAPRRGVGEVYGHHGEILQGVFYSSDGQVEHGLVTLPCPLFHTRARFRPMRGAPLRVEPGDRARARSAARLTIEALGYAGWGGSIEIESNVPLAWGCGSSTTDVLAVIRAVADAFDAPLEPQWLARLAVAAETASDSLMYSPERCVLFAQRVGIRLLDLGGPLPHVKVLGFNTEPGMGGVQTLALSPCRYSWWEIEAYRPLLGLLRRAVEQDDPRLLGRVASASAEIMQRHRPKRRMPELLCIGKAVGALGLQVAHSGTVAGFLFDPGDDAAERMEHARTRLQGLGLPGSWEFSTDYSQPTGGGR